MIGLHTGDEEIIPFTIILTLILIGVYFFMRRYLKEKFFRSSLFIVGLLWILYGYFRLKLVVPVRIWAVLDAPYNPRALQYFLGYDLLPIFAVLLTGSLFVLYASRLLKSPRRKPLKWLITLILYISVTAGLIMFTRGVIEFYYLIINIGSFQQFLENYYLVPIIEILVRPLLILFTGFCLFELLERKPVQDTVNTRIYNRRNSMMLLPISALFWVSAGIVNFVVEIIPVIQNRILYSWEMSGKFIDIFTGILDTFIATQLYYILVGILLFIFWIWNIKGEKSA